MALTNEQQAYLDALKGLVSDKEYSLIGEMMENGKDFAEVQKYANETILLENKLKESTAKEDEIYKNVSQGKDFRESSKSYLDAITDSYLKYEEQLEDKLVEILHNIKRYAEMDVTATTELYDKDEATYKEENQLFNKILKDLDAYEQTMEKDPDKTFEKNGVPVKYGNTQKMVYNMLGYFENLQAGNLKDDLYEQEKLKKDPNAEVNGVFIDATGKKFTSSSPIDYSKDLTDLPLFSHDPSPSDLRQGFIGDCYLMAGLSELARRDPQAIKDSMRDNGKTVTVRFWQRIENREAEMDDFKPVYVTVDKKGLGIGAAQNCCWAQIMERAYVASGLHLFKGYTDIYNKPRPNNLEEMYQDLKKMHPDDRPTMQECPWLIDKDGNLHEPKYDYSTIEGGDPGSFISAFMGPKYENHNIRLGNYLEGAVNPEDALTDLKYKLMEEFGIEPTLKKGEEKGFAGEDELDLARLEYKILGKDINTIQVKKDNLTGIMRPVPPEGSPFKPGMILSALYHAMRAKAEDGLNIATMDSTLSEAITEEKNPYLLLASTDEQKANIERVESFLKDQVRKIKTQCLGEELSGVYSNKANILYNKLKDWTGKGYPVTGGTYGESDKNNKEGVYDNHAYSVLGVEEKELGGKMMKFVRVRNPHGKVGRKYEVDENNKITRVKDTKCKDGEFLVELDDFIREYENVQYNAPVEKPNHIDADKVITPSCASKWNRVAMDLERSIKATDSWFSSDSEEYTQLKNSLANFRDVTGRCVGFDYNELRSNVAEIKNGANSYIRHLLKVSYPEYDSMDPKPTEIRMDKLSSRQKERYQVAKTVIEAADQYYQKSSRDPKQGMKDDLAESILGNLLERNSDHPHYGKLYQIYQQSPQGKEVMLNAFKKLPSLNRLLNNKSFSQLSQLKKMPGYKHLNLLKTDMAKMNAEKLQKEAQAKQEPPVAKRDDIIIRNRSNSVPSLGGPGLKV